MPQWCILGGILRSPSVACWKRVSAVGNRQVKVIGSMGGGQLQRGTHDMKIMARLELKINGRL